MCQPIARRGLWLGITMVASLALPGPARAGGLTTLASFARGSGLPASPVAIDSQGNLYGTTSPGGGQPSTVWELAKGSSTVTTLSTFSSAGASPYNGVGVTVDAQGNLYGTTIRGGADNDGTVWELAKGSGTITTIASFDSPNGFPAAGVTLDAQGNLFGTSTAGNGGGTVFEVAKGSGTITTLGTFNASIGNSPESNVTLDSQGNVFGTTSTHGPGGYGGVWELAKGSSTITLLAPFGTGSGDTSSPVVIDSQGNLFGTVYEGGANGNGYVYELVKGGSTLTILASFNDTNGYGPSGSLILDAQGNLYGTTASGGTGSFPDGTIWELAKGSGTITTLVNFDGPNGASPFGGLTLGSQGNFYGATEEGGANGVGTVFQFAPTPTSP